MVLPIVFLPVFFNSCAKKLNLDKEILYSKSSCPKPDNIEPISVNSKLSVEARSPFANAKLQLDQVSASGGAQQKLQQTNKLQAGYELSVIFRSKCLMNQDSPTANAFKLDLSNYIKNFNNSFSYHLVLEENIDKAELSSILHSDDCVVGASKSLKYKAQSVFAQEPYHMNQKAFYDSIEHSKAIELVQKDISEALNQSVKVAVIDTGVDYTHPDLKDNIIQLDSGQWGYKVSANEVVVGDPSDKSVNGHGTHVAGIIGAINGNQEGVSGLAYFAKILAINVFDNHPQGYHTKSSDVYNGIQKALQENVDIINLSVGQFSASYSEDASYLQGLLDAVTSNVLVVTVIGNTTDEYGTAEVDGVNLTVIPGIYGAAIDGVITVASIDAESNLLSEFSLYSQVYAEIAAPGAIGSEGIFSTIKSLDSSVPYGYLKGTSMAAPMVSSAAALAISILKQQGKAYSVKDLEDLIKSTAHRSYKLNCTVRDNQILNSLNLVEYLLSSP